MSKADEEAFVALKDLVDAGWEVRTSIFVSGYETSIFSRFSKNHHHFQDQTFIGSIFKAHKSIEGSK